MEFSMPTYTDTLSIERAGTADMLDLAPPTEPPGRNRRPAVEKLTRRTFGMGAAAAVTAAVTGCAADSSNPAAGSVDKVTFLTTFGSQGRDAYAYVADAKGFFAEVGIEVDIQPGKAGDYNHLALRSGQAQFACVDASGALIRYATGADKEFLILAAIHQKTLISIIALERSGIRTPKDLEGKTLGTATGAVPQTVFPAYAKLAGIDASKVTWQNAAPEALNSLVATGQIHGAGLFLVGQPGVEAAAGGAKAVVLPYSDYMRDPYGAVAIASKKIVLDNPDLARRFTVALLKGVDYSVKRPDEAGEILRKRFPAQNPKVAAAELTLMMPYVIAGPDVPIGLLDRDRVAQSVASLGAVGLLPTGSNPDLPGEIVNWDIARKVTE
jgi:NitT/TauT family transport system substrate-binding protein